MVTELVITDDGNVGWKNYPNGKTFFSKLTMTGLPRNKIKKVKSKTGMFCQCKESSIQTLGFFEKAPWKDGHWTYFELHKCLECQKLRGFPHDNFLHTLESGTDDTLDELRKLGVDVDRYRREVAFNPSRR